jgi:uncharacterized protein (DUF983 family)
MAGANFVYSWIQAASWVHLAVLRIFLCCLHRLAARRVAMAGPGNNAGIQMGQPGHVCCVKQTPAMQTSKCMRCHHHTVTRTNSDNNAIIIIIIIMLPDKP